MAETASCAGVAGAGRPMIEGVLRKREPLVEHADVDAVLSAFFGIRNELIGVRTILEEDDGEEREDP